MKKFYQAVIKARVFILILFAAAAVCGGIMQGMVAVNYDINDYLPKTAPSTMAIDLMEEEFSGGIPNARVMVKNVTIPEAEAYKDKILEVDGVTEVTWLGDAVDLMLPLSSLDKDAVETYYKDGDALLMVTIEDAKRISAVADIRKVIGDDNAMSGSAVSTAVSTESTVKEVQLITVIAVIFVTLVLILTTNSWFEPLLVLAGLGVAILLNGGSNLIFGEISFVTNAAGSVLQLAVSLDYSVFLIHRFAECRQEIADPKEAMVDALVKSTGSIASSGLTTVIGFLALVLMQFRIGPDLGLALAKGVAISLITVFLFMPALILMSYKWLDKTAHRPFVPSFQKLAGLVAKISVVLVFVFGLIVVPSYLASNRNDYYFGSSAIFNEETKLGQDIAEIQRVFGKGDTYVLLVPTGSTAKETALSNELHTLPQISSIISFVDRAGAEVPPEYLKKDTLAKLQSASYSRMVLSVKVDYEGKETFALVEKIRSIANVYYPGTYYLAGEGVSTYDLMDTVMADMTKVNLVAIAAVLVVLIASMKDLLLPVLLVLSIETAIWVNLSVPYFADQRIFYIAYLIISSIQLGATVDYAILMTDRYKENRQQLNRKEATKQTVADVTVSIATSGSVLAVVGLLMGFVSSNQLLAQLGVFIGRGALISMFIVLMVLPGILYMFDRLIIRAKKKSRAEKKRKKGVMIRNEKFA